MNGVLWHRALLLVAKRSAYACLPWREEGQIRQRYDHRDNEDSQHEFDHAFRGFFLCVAHATTTSMK
ncbi:hypothetical protein HX900_17535 [Rhizobium sp. WYCCWR 11290]|uniref:Uncharacterized protein n=1 Tax=Rhizobium changzhiense TaxID=2692317 RepID=A0A7Z0U9H0_9HYPH|nr:hypothetical protein [Rhizobium changzhiense]NZD62909.1 hypothetical protein [Rhizobium changzhiense]